MFKALAIMTSVSLHFAATKLKDHIKNRQTHKS